MRWPRRAGFGGVQGVGSYVTPSATTARSRALRGGEFGVVGGQGPAELVPAHSPADRPCASVVGGSRSAWSWSALLRMERAVAATGEGSTTLVVGVGCAARFISDAPLSQALVIHVVDVESGRRRCTSARGRPKPSADQPDGADRITFTSLAAASGLP